MATPQSPLNSGFGFHSTAEEVADKSVINGKTIVITGGHSGIGLETTKVLSKNGALVIVGARDIEKAKKALEGLKNVDLLPLDLSEPSSVDRFGQQTLAISKYIDVLVNNAGVMAIPLTRDKRGYEMQFATNHLGHFQLTARLLYALKATKKARVVTLTSAAHRFSNVDFEDPNFNNREYDKWKAYGQSKTANALFAVELDRRSQEMGIRSFSVHPGRITSTDLIRHLDEADLAAAGINKDGSTTAANKTPLKTIPEGAATTIWAATSPKLDDMGGVYCADCDISPLVTDVAAVPNGVLEWATDPQAAKDLWALTEKLLEHPRKN